MTEQPKVIRPEGMTAQVGVGDAPMLDREATCCGYTLGDLIFVAEMIRREEIEPSELHNRVQVFNYGYLRALKEQQNLLCKWISEWVQTKELDVKKV